MVCVQTRQPGELSNRPFAGGRARTHTAKQHMAMTTKATTAASSPLPLTDRSLSQAHTYTQIHFSNAQQIHGTHTRSDV